MLPPIFRGEIDHVPLMVSVWLRGLEDIEENLLAWTEGLSDEGLWWQPEPDFNTMGGLIKHMLGSSERLLAYAQGQTLSDAVRAAAKDELRPSGETVAELLTIAKTKLANVALGLKTFSETDLARVEHVGQKAIPVQVAFILHHLIEHAQLHMGQLILMRKLWNKQLESRL